MIIRDVRIGDPVVERIKALGLVVEPALNDARDRYDECGIVVMRPVEPRPQRAVKASWYPVDWLTVWSLPIESRIVLAGAKMTQPEVDAVEAILSSL